MFNRTGKKYHPDAIGMEVLQMMAKGYSGEKIAGILCIVHSTLRKRVETMKLKLGVDNIAQLMYQYGWYMHAKG
jgi:DNA-binding NarL/FixJ family response regulator